MVNGINALALTKLDVLDGLKEIKICTGYKYKDTVIEYMPSSRSIFSKLEPIYITMPGWDSPTCGVKNYDALPLNAKNYLNKLEELVGCKIALVSMGSSREETIISDESILDFSFGKKKV